MFLAFPLVVDPITIPGNQDEIEEKDDKIEGGEVTHEQEVDFTYPM
jgi:hypothetical protein